MHLCKIRYNKRMVILLHTSKTMRQVTNSSTTKSSAPPKETLQLVNYLKSLDVEQVKKVMSLSDTKARQTFDLIQSFNSEGATLPALDIFLGDIYSGMQVSTFTKEDRAYANDNRLFILSGLYGVLKPLDRVQPYRLEMGYKLPGNTHDTSQPDITSLYTFWGDKIAKRLPVGETIINVSAVEYTKAVFKYLDAPIIITPKFLTVSPKTGQPTFVTVHAKIARGSFARWIIQHRIETPEQLKNFNDIGYVYDTSLSTPDQPVFVAKEFKGLGLSVRLS